MIGAAQGTVIDLYREHIAANPPSTTAITSGGGAGATSVTLSSVVGIVPGGYITLYGGSAPETIQVASVSGSVVSFPPGVTVQNANHTNAAWGYGATVQESAAITAGGAQGTNTATFSNTAFLAAGTVVALVGGTGENITVQSVNYATGVVTFTTNIANTGHTSATWTSSGASAQTDWWTQNAQGYPNPSGLTGLNSAYVTNQPVRGWSQQLRQRGCGFQGSMGTSQT